MQGSPIIHKNRHIRGLPRIYFKASPVYRALIIVSLCIYIPKYIWSAGRPFTVTLLQAKTGQSNLLMKFRTSSSINDFLKCWYRHCLFFPETHMQFCGSGQIVERTKPCTDPHFVYTRGTLGTVQVFNPISQFRQVNHETFCTVYALKT